MKALILSCNTGSGHNACARAVQEALAQRGVPCDIRDGLAFVSEFVSRFVSRWHVRFYRYLPGLYGTLYRCAERHAHDTKGSSPGFRFWALGARSLRAFIAREGYTHVICTHLFPAMMLTAMQRRDPLPVRTAFIATDYTPSPGYESIAVDWCFIPTQNLAPEFEKPGLPPSHIVGCGIPVDSGFQGTADRAAARQALGFGPQQRHLLVMSGSMGCGPLELVLTQLAKVLGEDVEISVICGTNRRLFRRLNRRLGERKHFHIYDYVERISLFMDSADLYLTKPGGLSVSEALSKHLPMLLVEAVEGCETYNMRYCLELGAAVAPDKPRDVAALCDRLIHDDAALANMRKSMTGLFEPPAAQVVCDCLMDSGDEI